MLQNAVSDLCLDCLQIVQPFFALGISISYSLTYLKLKQEAHGPWVTRLSDIATAYMQMLCNIFPILSLQLMKRSSFKQFLILKKNIIYGMSMESDHLNKLSSHFNSRINVKFGGNWLCVSE